MGKAGVGPAADIAVPDTAQSDDDDLDCSLDGDIGHSFACLMCADSDDGTSLRNHCCCCSSCFSVSSFCWL